MAPAPTTWASTRWCGAARIRPAPRTRSPTEKVCASRCHWTCTTSASHTAKAAAQRSHGRVTAVGASGSVRTTSTNSATADAATVAVSSDDPLGGTQSKLARATADPLSPATPFVDPSSPPLRPSSRRTSDVRDQGHRRHQRAPPRPAHIPGPSVIHLDSSVRCPGATAHAGPASIAGPGCTPGQAVTCRTRLHCRDQRLRHSPDQLMPDQVMPDQVMPDQVMPDQVMPPVMPTRSCPTRSCRTRSCRPGHAGPGHPDQSCRDRSCPTTSCRSSCAVRASARCGVDALPRTSISP